MRPSAQKLSDTAGDLRARKAGDLGQVVPQHATLVARCLFVAKSPQGIAHPGMGGCTVGEGEGNRRIARHEGVYLLQCVQSLGL